MAQKLAIQTSYVVSEQVINVRLHHKEMEWKDFFVHSTVFIIFLSGFW